MSDQINNVLSKQLLTATDLIEQQVDKQLDKYKDLNDMTFENFASEIDAIRLKRLADMKKEAEMKKIYQSMGHGGYEELSNEKEFFQTTKSSSNVVIHFYEHSNIKCKIIDDLLKKMASKHLETKFVKVEASKVPFLKDNFKLKFIPLVLAVVDNIVKGRLINFEDISNIEDHSFKMLEWKLAKTNAINYDEDLIHPPEKFKPLKKMAKSIRGPAYDSSSDSELSD